MKHLIYHGANVNQLTEYEGWSSLHEAAASGQFEACKYLIQHGANVNEKTRTGFSVLEIAVFYGHEALVELFSQ